MKKGLIKIAEYIFAIGTIGGAALWLDARFDAAADRDKDVIEQVEYINAEQSMMSDDIWDIKDTLGRLEEKVDANSTSIDMNTRLMRYERQHRDEYTKDQMDAQLDEFEKIIKKNGNGIAATDGE